MSPTFRPIPNTGEKMQSAPDTHEDLYSAAGELLIGGFEGHTLTPEMKEALSSKQLGGAILFRRNISSLEQLVSLNEEIHQASAPRTPWVCVDQEGGRVRRLTSAIGATDFPSMRTLGETHDTDLVERLGEAMGAELRAVGFNVNFAPILDVDTNPDNPIIASRSFGADPAFVAQMAEHLMLGLHRGGVLSCGKHFPGHGDTHLDSHLDLPIVKHNAARLDTIELKPFRELIKAGIPMIMTAHLLIPALDEEHPATLSRKIITGLLRETLGFEGVIVSDDLEMAAVAARYSIEETITLGLRAGVDLFLICRESGRWQAAHRHLLKLGEESPEDRERIFVAARRIRALKKHRLSAATWSPLPQWRSFMGCEANRAIVAEVEGTQH